jgi:hypothetical protein
MKESLVRETPPNAVSFDPSVSHTWNGRDLNKDKRPLDFSIACYRFTFLTRDSSVMQTTIPAPPTLARRVNFDDRLRSRNRFSAHHKIPIEDLSFCRTVLQTRGFRADCGESGLLLLLIRRQHPVSLTQCSRAASNHTNGGILDGSKEMAASSLASKLKGLGTSHIIAKDDCIDKRKGRKRFIPHKSGMRDARTP